VIRPGFSSCVKETPSSARYAILNLFLLTLLVSDFVFLKGEKERSWAFFLSFRTQLC